MGSFWTTNFCKELKSELVHWELLQSGFNKTYLPPKGSTTIVSDFSLVSRLIQGQLEKMLKQNPGGKVYYGQCKSVEQQFFIMGWTGQCKKLLLLVTSDTLKYNGVELINNIHNSAMRPNSRQSFTSESKLSQNNPKYSSIMRSTVTGSTN